MITVYTLVVIWYLGSYAGQNVVVPNFPTLTACEQAGRQLTESTRHRPRMHCFATVMSR